MAVGVRRAPMGDPLRAYLHRVWGEVHARTGRPFDEEAIDRYPDGWVYDSALPCQALLTMRKISPAQEYRLFGALQTAFYRDAQDLTDPDIYPAILDDFHVIQDHFLKLMHQPETVDAVAEDFRRTRRLGAQSLPCLFVGDGESVTMVARGFQKARMFRKTLDALFPQLKRTPVSSSTSG